MTTDTETYRRIDRMMARPPEERARIIRLCECPELPAKPTGCRRSHRELEEEILSMLNAAKMQRGEIIARTQADRSVVDGIISRLVKQRLIKAKGSRGRYVYRAVRRG